MKKYYDIVVVGGGPAGMMAAISAKQTHPRLEVILLEKNKSCGNKLLLTGGGRCNLTANVDHNEIIKCTPKNGRFLYSALQQFDAQSIRSFFRDRGCESVVEEHHRVFPASQSAKSVLNVLIDSMHSLGVDCSYECEVLSCEVDTKQVITTKGTIRFDALVLATGGVSFTQTGSDGKGHEILTQLNHHVTQLKPCEVPLVSSDRFIQEKTLQGLSFKDIEITVHDGKKKKHFRHDLIVTHFGLSGPVALRSSFSVSEILEKKGSARISLNFIPDQPNEEADMTTLREQYQIPKRLIDYLLSLSSELTLTEQLRNFEMTIVATKGFASAFVTNGGLSIKEVDPKTMKSKLYPWLSICGELLDINGYTGGYNLTIAFSTGYCAGRWI